MKTRKAIIKSALAIATLTIGTQALADECWPPSKAGDWEDCRVQDETEAEKCVNLIKNSISHHGVLTQADPEKAAQCLALFKRDLLKEETE